MHKNRLDRLEGVFNRVNDVGVILVHVRASGKWEIPNLNFTGSIDEGRQLIDKYPNNPVIIDDVGRD